MANLTERIRDLYSHIKQHHKDYSNRRRLEMLLYRRKRLLQYLKRKSYERYLHVVKTVGIPVEHIEVRPDRDEKGRILENGQLKPKTQDRRQRKKQSS